VQVEAEEVEPLVPSRQAGVPGLVWMQLQAQVSKDLAYPPASLLGPCPTWRTTR
jgi:hypothetical protein